MRGAWEVFALLIRTVSRKLRWRRVRCLAQDQAALITHQSRALNAGVTPSAIRPQLAWDRRETREEWGWGEARQGPPQVCELLT